MTARRSILPVFFIILFSVLACKHRHHPAEETGAYDLTQIKDSGELVVLTLYSSTTYFIYRGQEMGFQYELSEQFAKSLGVKLRVEVARNVSELIQKLLSGDLPPRPEISVTEVLMPQRFNFCPAAAIWAAVTSLWICSRTRSSPDSAPI